MRRLISRRQILQGTGGLALLPLLPSLQARAEPIFPKRLVIFYHPNGVLPEKWFPKAGASETDFTLSSSLEPLAPFRDRLLIFRGVDLKCTSLGPGEPHQTGMGGVLTGWHLDEGTMVGGDGSLAGWAKGISVDQRIAQVIGPTTKLGSLLLGVRARGGDVRHHLSYSGPDQPLPVISDPRVAWERLFNDFMGSDPDLARVRARRRSVLDAVQTQLAALSRTLPTSERAQLDQHLELVRDMELRLAAGVSGEGCDVLPVPPEIATDDSHTMPDIAAWQTDLLVMALACDLTRVATLQFAQADNHVTFPFLDSAMEGHALSHLGGNDPTREQIGWRDRWYAERFADLLAKLDAVKEGAGTLLDHTLVFWVNEIAVGNTHIQRNMPFVMAGGGAGFRMGRYLQYNGASHTDLLFALLHAFGVNDTSFGNPDFLNGELPGLY